MPSVARRACSTPPASSNNTAATPSRENTGKRRLASSGSSRCIGRPAAVQVTSDVSRYSEISVENQSIPVSA